MFSVSPGDIHGKVLKMQSLWRNITTLTNSLRTFHDFDISVIFLGDYCDRGRDTRHTFDFLVDLPRAHADVSFNFLCGNHDHAFLKFLDNERNYAETCTDFSPLKPEVLYQGKGHHEMHLQGRRWAGVFEGQADSIYQSRATFDSYSSPYADREHLLANIPSHHLKFLRSLELVVDGDYEHYGRVIAVHAGLEEGNPEDVEEQIRQLKAWDDTKAWVEPLCGRKNVMDVPDSLLLEQTWVVSGHHSMFSIQGKRIIIDECGGMEDKRMSAVMMLPANSDLAVACASFCDGENISWSRCVDPLVKLLRIRSN